MRKDNFIYLSDGYKLTHWLQFKPGTQKIYSYLESRGTELKKADGSDYNNTLVYFGSSYYLKRLTGVVLESWMIEEAAIFAEAYFGNKTSFNRKEWEDLLYKYKGKLPLRIKSVKEGSVIPLKQVLATIQNTDTGDFPWLGQFIETYFLKIWYPISVATLGYGIRKDIEGSLIRTGSDKSVAAYKLIDFGYRGVSSEESAGIGGMAHLLNFRGTDNLMGIAYAMNEYNAPLGVGVSIPATEHSTMTPWGPGEGELECFRNLLEKYPNGLLSVVSDSFNIKQAISHWNDLGDLVMARDGCVVIRPDSGDPKKTTEYIVNKLWERFGGHRVLDSHVRIIQGDGVNHISIPGILTNFEDNGFGADNMVFGMGGALLQKLDRDTLKFAIKCSYTEINNQPINVIKSPTEINEHGEEVKSFKKSKTGKLKLEKTSDGYRTLSSKDNPGEYANAKDEVEVIFEDGVQYRKEEWEAIVNRVK